jgi:hypothetical protein
MAGVDSNEEIKITTEKCIHLDDMAGARHLVRDGLAVLSTSTKDHTTQYVLNTVLVAQAMLTIAGFAFYFTIRTHKLPHNKSPTAF